MFQKPKPFMQGHILQENWCQVVKSIFDINFQYDSYDNGNNLALYPPIFGLWLQINYYFK